jgi:hypothetical protein
MFASKTENTNYTTSMGIFGDRFFTVSTMVHLNTFQLTYLIVLPFRIYISYAILSSVNLKH